MSSTRPLGRIGSPIHLHQRPCFLDPAVGALLLDDVAEIQRVAACQLPQTGGGIRLYGTAQRRFKQLGGLVGGQRLQVDSVELAVFPYLPHRVGDRFTVAYGEHHFGGASLHDLMQHKRRQLIEQMRVRVVRRGVDLR